LATTASTPAGIASPTPGPRNDITDVAGISVGHHQRIGRGWLTGTTVVVPPPGTTASVDVRGGAPGTRDTDLLDPRAAVAAVDAICLTGGSAYGLAATDGVMAHLASLGRGFAVGPRPHEVVPIVPSAVIFDLGRAGNFANRPDASFGRLATIAALRRRRPLTGLAHGVVGAGTGARAGGLKGGIGSASVIVDGITVGALVVVNAAGSCVEQRSGALLGARTLLPGELAWLRTPTRADVRAATDALAEQLAIRRARNESLARNTTLAVIATDAQLAKSECHKLAGVGHDGLARAISPIHLMVDGDICFALATGTHPIAGSDTTAFADADSRTARFDRLLAAAADAVTRAVVHAALNATSVGEIVSYSDLYPSAVRHR